MILNCAKIMAQGTPFAKEGKLLKGSLPVTLIEYVLDEIRTAKKEQLDTNSVNALRLNAKNLMEDLFSCSRILQSTLPVAEST